MTKKEEPTTDGQVRKMKYCWCDKPEKNGGDNYCKKCSGYIDAKKREFDEIWFHCDDADELWSWIENEIRQAKIEELKKISELRLEYPSKNLGKWDTIMVGYMEERVSELEKEKI